MHRGKPSPRAMGLLVVLILAAIIPNMTGCACTAGWCETFRDAANPSIQSGVTYIIVGLIDGIFSIINTGSDVLGDQTVTYTGSTTTP